MLRSILLAAVLVFGAISANAQNKDKNDSTGTGEVTTMSIIPGEGDPPPTPPTPTVSSNVCGPKQLSHSGNHPPTISWYWQTSPSGTVWGNASNPYTISSPGSHTIYLRAFDHSVAKWSNYSSSVSFTVNGYPSTPGFITQQENCTNVTLTRGNPPSGVTFYWQGTNASGTSTSNSSSTYTASSNGTYYLRARSSAGCWSASSRSVQVTMPQAHPAITINDYSVSKSCASAVIYRDEPPSGYSWYWQTSSTGTSTSNFQSSWTVNQPGTYYLRSYKDANGCWGPSTPIAVTFSNVSPPNSDPAIRPNFGFSTIEIEAGTYFQGVNATGKNDAITDTEVTIYTPGTYYIRNRSAAGCWSSSYGFTVNSISEIPTFQYADDCSSTLTMSVAAIYNSYQWKRNGIVQASTTNSLTTNKTGTATISLIVTKAGHVDENENLIPYEIAVNLEDGVLKTNSTTVTSYLDAQATNSRVARSFSGGMGNILQSIAIGASPSGKDIISAVSYERNGEVTTQYLPYVGCDNNNGTFRMSALEYGGHYAGSEQEAFYTEAGVDYATDANPFAEVMNEKSPSRRTLETNSIGESWQNKYSSQDFRFNTLSDQVYQFSISNDLPVRGSYYAPKELIVMETESDLSPDARSVVFTDKSGNKILAIVKDAQGNSLRKVYYVYDDLGNLRFMLPTEIADNSVYDVTVLSNWGFQFLYNENGQIIEKRVPNGGVEYFVYDKYDRLVLTQNENLRSNSKWIFVKYDKANRPVITGLYENANNRSSVQGTVLSSTAAKYESLDDTGTHGYTNAAFPAAISEYLVLNYYDTYENAFTSYSDISGYPPASEIRTVYAAGMQTSSKVKVLNTTTWIESVYYYDYDNQLIQSQTQNYEGGTTRVTYTYNFAGELEKKKYQKIYGGTLDDITIDYAYAYDHQGRLLNLSHDINQQGSVTLAEYVYNELGQVKEKNLYSTDQVSFEQSVDYTYNIKGWLTSINQSDLLQPDNNALNSDYFGMNLAYEQGIESVEIEESQVQLMPLQDTYVENGAQSGTNYGNSQQLIVKTGQNPLRNTFIQFDVSSLSNIESASLNLYFYNGNSVSPTEYKVYAVSNDNWDEDLMTWNNQPSLSVQIGSFIVGQEDIYYSVDLSDYIKDEANTDGIVSLAIKHAGTTSKVIAFRSSESSWSKPYLEITYDNAVSSQSVLADQALRHDGQLSATSWSVYKGHGEAEVQAYSYLYDELKQFTDVTFYENSGTWNATSKLNEIVSYDQNGNITSMERRDEDAQLIDDLTYSYTTGNKINGITDNANAEGFEALGNYTYEIDGSVKTDPNKKITEIEYNFMQKPWKITMTDGTIIENIYDAQGYKYATTVTDGSTTVSRTYSGLVEYVDDGTGNAIDQISHEEGRIVKAVDGSFEYQYFLTDQLGNVRTTFTTRENDYPGFVAEMEDQSADENEGFVNINPVADPDATSGTKVARLNNATPVGPGFQLAVYPGDQVDISVKGYHRGGTNFNTLVQTISGSVAGIFGPTSSPADQFIYSKMDNAVGTIGIQGTSEATRPAAYLNYILFNEDFSSYQSGHVQIGAAPNVIHDLDFGGPLNITEEGYLYVFLTYESNRPEFVYFDDLTVDLDPGKVIQVANYYPYGLEHASSWMRADHPNNPYRYNGGSEYDELLKYIKTPFRHYDPSIGRFMGVDQMASSFSSLTPYHFAGNNPVNANDPTGLYPSWNAEMQQWLNSFPQRSVWNLAGQYDSYGRNGPFQGGGNHWTDSYHDGNSYMDFFLMSGLDFESKWGVSSYDYHSKFQELQGVLSQLTNSTGDPSKIAYKWKGWSGKLYRGGKMPTGHFSILLNSMEIWAQEKRAQTWYFMHREEGGGAHGLAYDPYENIIYEVNHPENGDGFINWAWGPIYNFFLGLSPAGHYTSKHSDIKSVVYQWDMDVSSEREAFWEREKGATFLLAPVYIADPAAATDWFQSKNGQEWNYNFFTDNCGDYACKGMNAGGAGIDITTWARPSQFPGKFEMRWSSGESKPSYITYNGGSLGGSRQGKIK